MGAYLSEPVTKKYSSDHSGGNLVCGASSMQGWRMSQEDAHNCVVDFDEDTSLFAVYDGHGGHEVALYCSKNLPEFIKSTDAYKKGDIRQALIDAFLGFDATLATPEIISILKEIAGAKGSDHGKTDGDDSDVEENVNNLCMEATMPLDKVLAKYQSAEDTNPSIKGNPTENCASRFQIYKLPSGYLRSRRSKDRGACSSSGAGCSSSSSSWNTNETDVSSSSQPCESSSSSSSSNRKIVETAGSSEADHVLDSTTSNGDVPRTSQVGSSVDSEPAKSSEMPDSSEDVNDKVSPSKVSNSSSTPNEAEVNGEKPSKSVEAADSSKSAGDNECSSSCTPLENGEAEQHKDKPKKINRDLAIKLLMNICKDYSTNPQTSNKADDSEDDDDDDDDENDETFDGQPESDDDDDGDGDNDSNEDDDDDDDDDDEDDDEDGDDEYEDDIDISKGEEPGADSGCTAVVAILKGKELYVANAGDSRCVLCRDGVAVELSLDHKPEDQPEMERIVKAGGKVTADGRVNGGLNLSRALGDHSYKKNKDLPPEEQMISALPDIKTVTLDPEKDEFMILACDGIWNFMSSQNVVNFIRTRIQQGTYENVSKICEELFDYCLAPNTVGDGTGCDNMTAIIVQFKATQNKEGKENLTAEVTSVTKKRPVSPGVPANEADCNTTEESAIDECKRMKTETC